MAIRYYLVPKVGTGQTIDDSFRPKYFVDGLGRALVGVPETNQYTDYGLEPYFLVTSDVTAGEHTTVTGNADVTALPANLDQALGQNLATVAAALEAHGFPADWPDATTTYRELLVMVKRCCAFAQQLHGLRNVRIFPAGITLSSTVSSLTANQRQRMADAITALGGTFSEITAGMTMRVALKKIADQLTTVQ